MNNNFIESLIKPQQEPVSEEFLEHPISSMMLRWETIIDEAVLFHGDKLGSQTATMMASEFHMPFYSMYFTFAKPYLFGDRKVSQLRLVDRWEAERIKGARGKVFRYAIVSNDFPDAISFNIRETGEIEVSSFDTDKFSLEEFASLSTEEAEEMLKAKHESNLYNLVYDLIATIDDINNSQYIVTTHTTDRKTGQRLPSGKVQKRIKIKHVKIKRPNYHGTGTGTKHRYKYRVRGHWRDYEDGKRTWIKDHVRGGDGSIFIPKEYDVL